MCVCDLYVTGRAGGDSRCVEADRDVMECADAYPTSMKVPQASGTYNTLTREMKKHTLPASLDALFEDMFP